MESNKEQNRIEIKGNFVYINDKLIKPKIIKLKDVGFSYPFEVSSMETAYVDSIITEEEGYIYRIIVIPPKKIGGYYNKFPAHSYDKYSYFQLIKGSAKIQNFYEDEVGRGFYALENMEQNKTYIIEKNTYVSIANISYDRVAIVAKTPKNYKESKEAFFIGEEIEQNPEFLAFGERIIKKEKYSLVNEILLRIKSE